MKQRFVTLTTAASLLALLLLAGALPAGADLAKIKNVGDALVFSPLEEAKEYVLTVSGPCGYEYRESFTRGEIVFKLPREAIAGSYSYSLVATPIIDPEVMEILRATREIDENGRRRELCREGKLPVALKQSGGFTVYENKIVLDTAPETDRSTRDPEK